ncbi:type II toxin-antitoxin system RelE/ParE family toxin [Hyphomicrobium sp.]|uniref:type II toxin-antitoxin system RelE/ParE family toxin n=1 Tax=Hyphomicrobium sp. TaxID=82 RepID=UPI0025BBCFF1|nr:type II toxin-antitoxin system RelE/ParE family toxin [Hyphomicrobium sp.]MCC7250456.1 type II toxin-antitoxin system RelE/ParE family toxin [Hyphomicrobium sp.]
MASYRLTNRAAGDLDNIYLYTLTTFGYRQAEDYARAMYQVFEDLAANPRLGREAEDIRSGLRRHEHDRHVIFYRVDGNGVLILTLLHEAMDHQIHF